VSWIRELTALHPDIVVGTGDFLGHPEGLGALTEALIPFAGIPGVVTHGSNDRVAPRPKNPFSYVLAPSAPRDEHSGEAMDFVGLQALYERLGWVDIDNAVTHMEIRGSALEWVGVGDAHYGLDDLSGLPGLLDEAREAREGGSTSLTTLGVTHAPYQRVLNALQNHGAEAIFAGLFSYFFWGEIFTARKLGGALLILAGILITELCPVLIARYSAYRDAAAGKEQPHLK
jgi:hypothetical protein